MWGREGVRAARWLELYLAGHEVCLLRLGSVWQRVARGRNGGFRLSLRSVVGLFLGSFLG